MNLCIYTSLFDCVTELWVIVWERQAQERVFGTFQMWTSSLVGKSSSLCRWCPWAKGRDPQHFDSCQILQFLQPQWTHQHGMGLPVPHWHGRHRFSELAEPGPRSLYFWHPVKYVTCESMFRWTVLLNL